MMKTTKTALLIIATGVIISGVVGGFLYFTKDIRYPVEISYLQPDYITVANGYNSLINGNIGDAELYLEWINEGLYTCFVYNRSTTNALPWFFHLINSSKVLRDIAYSQWLSFSDWWGKNEDKLTEKTKYYIGSLKMDCCARLTDLDERISEQEHTLNKFKEVNEDFTKGGV